MTSAPGLTYERSLAGVVQQLVEDGDFDDEPFALRWLLNQFARNDWDAMSTEDRVASLRRQPTSTESRRWNAFVAGLADYLCERSELDRPSWLAHSHADVTNELWYVGRGQSAAAERLIALDPAPWFLSRGVGLDAASLPS